VQPRPDCDRSRPGHASREIRIPRSESFAFLDRLARESAAMLGLPAAQDVRAALGVRGAGTLRFHLQGLGHLLAG
jgi:hypothetical protein